MAAAATAALPALPRRLLALCKHGSYGVRVEAAVALAGLVQVRWRWRLSMYIWGGGTESFIKFLSTPPKQNN
jgi:hypothetical protein